MAWRYLFVVENLFLHMGHRVHGLEHYLEASLDRDDVRSREPRLEQEWLPVDSLSDIDLRPAVVRDVLASDRHRETRHLIANGWG